MGLLCILLLQSLPYDALHLLSELLNVACDLDFIKLLVYVRFERSAHDVLPLRCGKLICEPNQQLLLVTKRPLAQFPQSILQVLNVVTLQLEYKLDYII